LQTCCLTLPSGDQSGCTDIADTNDQTICQEELAAFDDAGVCH